MVDKFSLLSTVLVLVSFLTFVTLVSIDPGPENLNITRDFPEQQAATESNDENEAVFHKMMDVLTHQRCINCHPSDDVPKQGEDSHPHRFDITRANSNAATDCKTCHQVSNNSFSGVPGAPEWALAPHSMRWEGLTRKEIAESMMDPERNGNRSPAEIKKHLTEHELVLWAWEPGVDANGNPREKPPVSKEEYIEAVEKWIESGSQIPENANQ